MPISPAWGRSLAAGASLAVLAAVALTATDRAAAVVTTPVTATVTVSGAGPYLQDLNLRTDILHEHTNDLEIHLTSPEGTRVPVSTRSPLLRDGNSQIDVFAGTVWDDDAGDPVTDHDFAPGTAARLTPEGALGAFIGEDPNGTWTLTVADQDPFATGTLRGFSLDVVTQASAPVVGTASGNNAAPTPIPDPSSASATASPATQSLSIFSGGGYNYIQDVSLVTSLNHPAAGELRVELTSPAGTTETISSRNGGVGNVFNGITFDDAAGAPHTRPVTDHAFTTSVPSVVPEGALGNFVGENPTGTWTLRVLDEVHGNAGGIDNFALSIEMLAGAPATTSRTVTSAAGPTAIPDAQPDPAPPVAAPDPAPGLAPVPLLPGPAPAAPGTTTPSEPAPRQPTGTRAARLLGVSTPARVAVKAPARIVARFAAAPLGRVVLQRGRGRTFRNVASAPVRGGRAVLTYRPATAGRHVLRVRYRVPNGVRYGRAFTVRATPAR